MAAGEVPALDALAGSLAALPAGAGTPEQLAALQDEIAGLLGELGAAHGEVGRQLAELAVRGRAHRAYGR